jgi:TolB-like protein/DNA-binding winged helix-turn-helix (wHTH) protein/Tfp pilus assembly protein PilF
MNQQPAYRFDDFVVDPEAWQLYRAGQEIHLEPVVLELLIYLISHRDGLVTRRELMDTVWGDTVISESALSQAIFRLRKALQDASATPHYVETVHSKGYRFIAEVEEIGSRVHVVPRQSWRGLYAGAAAIVALILLAVFWVLAPLQDASQNEQIQSLAVLPLSNLTGDPGQAYFADGLQDILITQLSQVPGLRVMSRQSTKRYRNSEMSTADIAGELAVDALVEGSLLRKDDNIEITVQLVDGRSDVHLWAEQYSGEASHIFNLISDVAYAIGLEVRPTEMSLVSSDPVRTSIDWVEPRAIDSYALGVSHLDRFTRDDIRTAIDQFETAVAIEPKFALAWGQLAAAHAMEALFGFAVPRESIEKARIAALRAIEADDKMSIGYADLGYVKLWTGDIDGACESIQEALRLNPSEPYALHGDADCLMLDGRVDESVARTRDLLMVGPFSAMHSLPLAFHLYVARRFDKAIAAAKDTQLRTPQFSMHWFLALIYWQQGRFDLALQEERLELERRGDTVLLAALEEGFDANGPTGALRAMAETLVERANESYVDPFDIGETFARAGMVGEALHWLEKAVEYGSYDITHMAFRPEFDAFSNDPQYQELLQRIYGERADEILRIANTLRSQDQ